MAYIGIGYCGKKSSFLKNLADKHMQWLKGDRLPRFFGDSFVVLYDSNTAREFAKKCLQEAEENSIVVYPMQRPLQWNISVASNRTVQDEGQKESRDNYAND